ncbi:hypothetical protein TNCV_1183981 [Trichonephila clavipes]|nr:hypothetical protein TNCV_1183981 [Trichonephila clavipes]
MADGSAEYMGRPWAPTVQRCSVGCLASNAYKKGAAVKNSLPPQTMIPGAGPAEAGLVSKRNVVPFRCPRSSHNWRHKLLLFPVKGKLSNGHLADIPLCCKWRRMVQVDTK